MDHDRIDFHTMPLNHPSNSKYLFLAHSHGRPRSFHVVASKNHRTQRSACDEKHHKVIEMLFSTKELRATEGCNCCLEFLL